MLLIATVAPIVIGKNLINPKKEFSSAGSLIITLQAGKYSINNLENEYTEILMEEYGSLISPGEPTLPSKLFSIGLPPGGKALSIELINIESEDIPGVYHIKPGLPINDKQNNEINTETYNSNKPYPANTFEYLGMSQMRKYSLAMIRFSPITYYPADGKLVLHKSIMLRINYEIVEEISAVLRADTAIDDVASKIIFNYDSIAKYYTPSQPIRQTYDYVIITTSPVVSSLTTFMNWKINLGYKVNISTITWIQTNYPAVDAQASIRSFLASNYASWGIKYVLIVGTYASIPMRMCYPDPTNHNPDGIHDIPTDYYYADLTGNWDSDGDGFYGERGQDNIDFVPEVFVGRIPTDGPTAVSSIALKIQQFEQTAYTGWKRNAMLLGAIYNYANENNSGNPRLDGAEVMEQCKNNLLSGFSITTMYEKQGFGQCSYPCTFPLNNTNVKSQWGSATGWGIVNWAAHGLATSASRTVWNTDDGDGIPEYNGEIIWPIMIQSSDNGVLNNNKPPIVFAASCFVSQAEIPGNLGMSLLVNGASAFVGATRVSYASQGWMQPSHGGHGTICYDFTDRIANKNEDCGHALYNAKQYVYNSYPWNLWQDNANMYNFNLYGDPSMGINTAPVAQAPPTGPTTGIAGLQYVYTAIAIDPANDKIKYGWDWNGDGTVDQWDNNNGNYYPSGQPSIMTHTFNSPGTYNIKVKAEDIYGKQSSFSPQLTVVITQNQAPTKPAKPSGQTNGKPGVSYTYTTSATDPESYNVAYGWDWNGDGTVDQWDDNNTNYYPSGQTISTSHSWPVKGTYNIKVKAKDIHGNEGPWSDPLPIKIPKNGVSTQTLLQRFFERFPHAFPILRHLLYV